MTMSNMMNEIRRLPREDLMLLMQAILDEMSSQSLTLTDEQKEELDRRIADDDARPDEGEAWDDVLRDARARHGR